MCRPRRVCVALCCARALADDDWFEAPFLRGGESLAHWNATLEFGIEWELLETAFEQQEIYLFTKGRIICRKVLFRVVAVGSAAPSSGITPRLVERSCRARAQTSKGAVVRMPVPECLHQAKAMLQLSDTGLDRSDLVGLALGPSHRTRSTTRRWRGMV